MVLCSQDAGSVAKVPGPCTPTDSTHCRKIGQNKKESRRSALLFPVSSGPSERALSLCFARGRLVRQSLAEPALRSGAELFHVRDVDIEHDEPDDDAYDEINE